MLVDHRDPPQPWTLYRRPCRRTMEGSVKDPGRIKEEFRMEARRILEGPKFGGSEQMVEREIDNLLL